MNENGKDSKTSWLAGLVFAWEIGKLITKSLRSVFQHPPRALEPGQTGREADQDEDRAVNFQRRMGWGTWFVACAYLLSLAGGIAFIYTYWSSANVTVMGGALALAFGALGLALVLQAHWLTHHKQAVEPREILVSSREERQQVFQEFYGGGQEVKRRSLLKWMVAAIATTFAAAFVSTLRSLGAPPEQTLFNREWQRGQRLVTIEGQPIAVDSLAIGSMMVVFPEDKIGSERAQTVLLRVKEQYLQLPEERSDWAPSGYLAYSRVCTHAGCAVGMYETTTDQLLCPCHQSSFDVLRGAKPTGGPAARALPQLPLYADSDGYLRAGGGFSEPPGPGFWGMPE